jgi:homopolymeric O-antigen transport system ATP-binding protein
LSDLAISCQNLGKLYQIGPRERYRTLRESIVETLGRPFRRNHANAVSGEDSTFWALKNVSFDVRHGEVVGIVGRNGAGKSTLLKILSRITEPTVGSALIRGRVGSLLEVGTGFHPELTGRENIYLNGAILGMRRPEVERKFDEIVAFAEVERFLDTPVKRYSSGMYVRLAFAVAAHLEPEILVIDEVLAVGDAEFQKKCLGKMEHAAHKEGRTVLFVSHNIAAVEALCSAAILMSGGEVVDTGPTRKIVQAYLNHTRHTGAIALEDRRDREGSGALRFTSIALENSSGLGVDAFQCGNDATVVLGIQNGSGHDLRNVSISVGVDNGFGNRVLLLDSSLVGADLEKVPPGNGVIRIALPRLSLMPGRYYITLFVTANAVICDWVKNAGSFDVHGGDYFGTGRLPPDGQGIFVMPHSFRYEAVGAGLVRIGDECG